VQGFGAGVVLDMCHTGVVLDRPYLLDVCHTSLMCVKTHACVSRLMHASHIHAHTYIPTYTHTRTAHSPTLLTHTLKLKSETQSNIAHTHT